MKTITLTIGHNVFDGHAIRLTSAEVIAATVELLVLDGLTAYETRGMWRGMCEDSTRIEVCGLTEQEAARIVAALPALAHALKQEEIACEVREDSMRFVAAFKPAESAATA